ncbi:hypothetical protein BZG72_01745 [Salinivibrio sp. PR6]|uniref:hypothetical protein n=1 Tax=Salinivibrio sp. PR6 TaxID=1909485 RepID=UPI00098994B2|nr:hypothetical protein [Salinivibrio sp. PR6]OOE84677.1 hypothetical protein BZG72_01745 [Salinivibrio sp. PR6]
MNCFNLIGFTYQDLIKRPEFTVLIGGNVPSTIDGFEDKFYIESYTKGLEFQFDANSSKLKVIIATNPDYFMGDLKNKLTKELVRAAMGEPRESMSEKKVPVLGMVGAWDKYIDSEGHTAQVLYEVGADKVKSVFYR